MNRDKETLYLLLLNLIETEAQYAANEPFNRNDCSDSLARYKAREEFRVVFMEFFQ